ncbi:MAG: Aspartyl/glutamyl-tRNA(Asn/Gln) amidotransferase subunit B [Microgenomates group bacterium ADurb.Bin219]|nr:MAG: Aspartyl/glutamyl-tRNA(Asn/Gln) amidotransferase subunit B [Microgenomates group bacterium ADurb.Bin219]HNP89362.1 Asp-tRNA(Asn)/Glu-tRNA(Gln) amidotransferase subunit GatB [Candidatus Woesebacteria bacterium]
MKLKRILIGLEIHIELKTKSKMFCGCSAVHFEKIPNSQTCPVCLGLPGALPVPNFKAIESVILIGQALNCEILKESKFDRKNYFYPDLPKGYQISQYDQPFCLNGWLEYKIQGTNYRAKIRRVHLEEDTGKLVHTQVKGKSCSLIDFNRSGCPLVEIVTEPEFDSSLAAKTFLEKLQKIVRYLEVADADMEKGQMRCEPTVNLEIEDGGKNYFTPLVEIKNINSFRFVQKAIDFEVERQFKDFEEKRIEKMPGNKTTRGWSEKKLETGLQRTKEEASDYRYFPEPDIPPIFWSDKQITNFKELFKKIVLPDKLESRFISLYGLRPEQAEILCRDKETAFYFEKCVELGKIKKITSLDIVNKLINQSKKAKQFADLSPKEFIEKIGESQKLFSLNKEEISLIADRVLKENQKIQDEYRKGKTQVLGFLIGLVQKEAKGKADPRIVQKILAEKLA